MNKLKINWNRPYNINIFLLLAIVIAICSLAFTIKSKMDSSETFDTAKVQQIEGFYIFIKSEPISPYTTVGETKCGAIVLDNSFTALLKLHIKKARKQHKRANGLIFNSTEGMDKAIIIHMK